MGRQSSTDLNTFAHRAQRVMAGRLSDYTAPTDKAHGRLVTLKHAALKTEASGQRSLEGDHVTVSSRTAAGYVP